MALDTSSARTDVNWTPLPVPWAVQTADRIPKQRYYDPEFYALETETVLAARVADGVPARGDPQARRLRRVRDPRPVDHRRPARRRQRARLPQRVPPSRREARGGQRIPAHLRLPVPRLVLGHRRTQHLRAAARGVRRAQPVPGRSRARLRSDASSGAGARGSTSTTTPRRCGTASSRSRRSTTRGRSSRCASSGGSRAGCR